MSFFIKGKQLNGVKRAKFSKLKPKKRKFESKSSKNDEITSSEDEEADEDRSEHLTSSEDENETAQEKKLRLAKIYLKEIEKEEKARLEQDEIDQSVIAKRLKEDYLKETGKLRLTVADRYNKYDETNIKTLKCKQQRNSITCLCISSDNKFLFSGSKDGLVVKYSLKDFKKLGIIPYTWKSDGEILGHNSEVLSIAISTDSRFLAVGDKKGNVFVWDPNELKHIKTLTGHKSAVLGVTFKKESHVLYSCSQDKTVKVWSLDEMAFVETLFGHQDLVASVDSLYRDRIVTSGGHDLRIWKITEETQLIYNGHVGNIDNVRLINEENFVSGGDDGQICVWSVLRKKPLQCIENAHGKDLFNEQPRWITALAALTNTDLIASGSYDGFVRLWKLENNFRSSVEVLKISVQGVVNALAFTSDGGSLLIGVSRDYRLGRWNTVKNAKNCILFVPFVIES
ncbi:U3 small nucleolar RNA-interacting protein 2 [Sitophilus oryzae]|uniref:U3 small nucleolar RNA-interacting protein 2 n=1 Tax=Sitophilus oryzae TaxID=7048 RepID=A0A6J2Y5Z4_SITOR|nr:U3 small nucleolar RNA-interacting protein 2 [Sitophilus oryzae]